MFHRKGFTATFNSIILNREIIEKSERIYGEIVRHISAFTTIGEQNYKIPEEDFFYKTFFGN